MISPEHFLGGEKKMCGVAGWVVKDCRESLKFAAVALGLAIEPRGDDSWGALYASEKRFDVLRGLGRISSGLLLPSLWRWPKVLLHTRAASVGKVCKENAHPLECEHIFLTHNGSVGNYRELQEQFGVHHEVDSYQLAACLAGRVPEERVWWGGAAVWYDSRDGKVRLVRTSSGSLWYAVTELGTFWASTASALRAALAQAELEKGAHILEVPDGAVYRVGERGLDFERVFRAHEHYLVRRYYSFGDALCGVAGDCGGLRTDNGVSVDIKREKRKKKKGGRYGVRILHFDRNGRLVG
jgi:asparagine synthetase B (glutamine-hydrolysing)